MLAAQIVAVVIFVFMFVMIIMEKIERQWITLLCALAVIIVVFGILMHSGSAIWETINLGDFATSGFWYGSAEESSSGVNWATIVFIGCMMIMVEGMARAGFFRWLCLLMGKMVRYKPIPLLLVFMVMSAVLSMFISSITVILFLAVVTIEVGKLIKFNPVPMIIAEIFCANIGGAATMCGDPPNIIIGTSLHYTFVDFFKNTGVIAFVCLAFSLVYFYFVYRKKLTQDIPENVDVSSMPAPGSAIVNKGSFAVSAVIFAAAIILLVTHGRTGLTVALIGIIIAVATLLTSGKHMWEIIKKIDYKTLLFFVGLFIVVGGLEQTQILELIANFIARVSGGNVFVMVAIVIWVSAIASAFVDNIPFAATMLPVIQSLAATTGVPLTTLAWTLALGTDIGGSATTIGASANVVGTSVLAKNGKPVGWGEFCRASVPAMIIVIAICMLLVFVRYC